MNNEKKRILRMAIVGAGGSGPSVQRALFADSNILWDIFLGVDDAYGSTGVLTKVLQRIRLEKFGASERFQERSRIIPIGDTRNNILRMLNFRDQKGSDIAAILNQRLPVTDNLKQKLIEDFIHVLNLLEIDENILGSSFHEQLNLFIEEYIYTYNLYENEILKEIQEESDFKVEQLKDLCFGNLFLMFFALSSESNEAFFETLKEIKLVPDNINFHYIAEHRHVLMGEDDLRNKRIGEQNVDASTRPLNFADFSLIPVDEKGKPKKVIDVNNQLHYDSLHPYEINPEYIEILKRANTIFLSTGSYANLSPGVSLLVQGLKETKALIMYVSNFAMTDNEVHAQFAIDILYRMIGKPFVTLLVNQKLSETLLKDPIIKADYMKEGKFFNDVSPIIRFLTNNTKKEDGSIDEAFIGRVLPILNLMHNDEQLVDHESTLDLERGLKHEPYEIADITIFFTGIYHLIDMYELNDIQAKDFMFNSIIKALRLTDFKNSEFQEYVKFLREIATSDIPSEEKFNVLGEVQKFFDLENVNILDFIEDFRINRLNEFAVR